MIASLLVLIGMLFLVLVLQAWSSGEIRARGWGLSTRIYCRASEPVGYWVSLASYLVITIWTTALGVLAALGRTF